MTQTDFLIGFMMLVMGYILGLCVIEATQEYRETKRIKRDWEAMKRKEINHE